MAHRTDIGLKERRLFLLMIFLYLAIRLARSVSIGPEFIHFYGGDLLFIPILMTSIKIVRKLFNFSFGIGKMQVGIAVVYAAVVFEWLLPNEGTNFVSDPIDIAAYALGALIYIFVISNKSPSKFSEKSLSSQ